MFQQLKSSMSLKLFHLFTMVACGFIFMPKKVFAEHSKLKNLLKRKIYV